MSTGVLVECDASIKAIIVNINTANGNAYIIEDIDDEHVLIQASKHQELKDKLNEVCAWQKFILISTTGADFHRPSKIQSASLKTLSLSDLSTTLSFAKEDFPEAVHTTFNETVGSLFSSIIM
jgi:TFIIH basal transcription factor complex TTD-A subunit